MSTQTIPSAGDGRSEDNEEQVAPSDTTSELAHDDSIRPSANTQSIQRRGSKPKHVSFQASQRYVVAANHGKKPKASRKYFSDGYLELFNKEILDIETGNDDVPSTDLFESQIGTVHWLPSEKERFFNAVSRYGRLDLPRIAALVGKSQLEVQDYLLLLRERELERHLFEKQTKRISLAEIPCAIEISKDCETALQQAADALGTFQDQYDRALSEQQHPGIWLIDSGVAQALDEHVLDQEEAAVVVGDLENVPAMTDVPGEGLFCLSSWLELSERFFMNAGPPRLDENWQNITSKDEQPAITFAAFSEFHELAVNMTRRLVQTALFLAKSRIQSVSYESFQASPIVKKQDMHAALELLGMSGRMDDFLLGVAKRNSLRVIHGTHDKGISRSQVLTYEEVDKNISERKISNRRLRSVSATSRSSRASDTSDASVSTAEDDKALERDKATMASEPMSSKNLQSKIAAARRAREWSPSDGLDEDTDTEETVSEHDTDDDDEDLQADEYGGLAFHPSTSRQKRRQVYLEHQQDAYVEELDNLKSEREETHLWQILDRDPPPSIKKETDNNLGIRPKTLRKTREELEDWQGTFCAEWEAFGEPVPNQSFDETGRRKRGRSEDSSGGQNRDEQRPLKVRVLPIRSARSVQDEESDDNAI